MKIKLNCDMGESFGIWKMGEDKAIFPLIDMANLACGYHAGDAITMQNSVKLAKKYKTKIGAHIAYDDLNGFGRRSMNCTALEIQTLCIYQIGALQAFCKTYNTKVSYVKPHGALYNDMMKNEDIFLCIVKAISSYDKKIKLMILSTLNNKTYKKIAKKFNIKLIYEVFADRNYTNDGYLVKRSDKNAVIKDKNIINKRIKLLKEKGTILSIDDKKLKLKANSICVHGDNSEALVFIKTIKELLD